MSTRRNTLINLIWAGLGQYGSQAIHYGVILFLAIMLSPKDFGLLGISMIFIQFVQAIGELGLGAAIIEKEKTNEEILSTVFWITLVIGLLLMLLSYAGSDLITTFFGDKDASILLKALSILLPIISLSVVPRALLERKLEFQKIAIRDFASEIAYGIVGCVMAILGYGVWSLVGASLAQKIIGMLGLWLSSRWTPKFIFSWQELKKMLNFGLSASFSGLLNKTLQNIDYFIIGRWLGSEALGYYTLAFQIAVISQRRTTYIVSRVAYPTLAQTRNDFEKLKKGFLEVVKHLLVLLTLATLLLITVAPWFIDVLYGEKWSYAIVPIQILAFAGFFYSAEITHALYFSLGKPQWRFVVIGVRIIVFLLAVIAFGLKMGIVGIAISLVLSSIISWLVSYNISNRMIDVRWKEFFLNIWKSMIAIGVVFILFLIIITQMSHRIDYLVYILVGIPVILSFLLIVRTDLISLLNTLFVRKNQ